MVKKTMVPQKKRSMLKTPSKLVFSTTTAYHIRDGENSGSVLSGPNTSFNNSNSNPHVKVPTMTVVNTL